ncbi:MFS transporter [Kribbella turkmenica]|uniref:MFS transporter n=1 Tax=Kribbella turkmenica TaxID=2530375 RepID=A0A4R4XCX3_9ACTN|nr:MFS transporter [Kribbella turkmenica]TDD28289.1 MFS transporter [Kribbella turkmenica]
MVRGVLPAAGPLRPLALATLLSRVGSGLLMTVSVLYFDRIIGLSIAQVGLGLTIAGLSGLLSAVPMGHLADRRGPRTLVVVLSLMLCGLSLLYLLVQNFWQFLVVSVVLTIQYAVLEVAIPLWVVDHTDAPRWTVALLIINTAVVALFQVLSSRGIADPATAARATRTAGLLLLASMVLFAGASWGNAAIAVALLAVGALVQVLGELLQSSGSFLLGFDLAAEPAQGQYQGVWNTSMSISTMVAPTVLALLPLGLGVPGWIILGVWFALIGVLFVPVVRWAAARRKRSGQIHTAGA